MRTAACLLNQHAGLYCFADTIIASVNRALSDIYFYRACPIQAPGPQPASNSLRRASGACGKLNSVLSFVSGQCSICAHHHRNHHAVGSGIAVAPDDWCSFCARQEPWSVKEEAMKNAMDSMLLCNWITDCDRMEGEKQAEKPIFGMRMRGAMRCGECQWSLRYETGGMDWWKAEGLG
jgi:hypothetical protein